MIAYVTVGADDIARAKRFYNAFLPALGYGLTEGPEGLSYALPVPSQGAPVLPDFYVKPTFDGRPASAGNGSMTAFEAKNQQQVRAIIESINETLETGQSNLAATHEIEQLALIGLYG